MFQGVEDDIRGVSKGEVVLPDHSQQNLLIQCSDTNEIICINIEEGNNYLIIFLSTFKFELFLANIQGSGAYAMLDEKPVQKTLMTAPGNSKVSNQMDLSNNVIKKYKSGNSPDFM